MTARRQGGLLHEELTDTVLGVFFQVHYELGAGFLESVYAGAMAFALIDAGLDVQREVPIGVYFRGQRIGSFRADLLVESKVLLELKAGLALEQSAKAQLLHYLRATDIELGLLLHFGERPTFERLIYTNDRKLRASRRETAV